jgi:hypothetical protein
LARLTPAYDTAHLIRFRSSLDRVPKQDLIGGKNAKLFAAGLPGAAWDDLPLGLISRSQVFDLCAAKSVPIATLCAAIFAWGGMHLENRNRLIKDLSWLDVAQDIRDGNLSRKSAFDAFRVLRRRKKLSGLGPAFFTKLIYFLSPRASAPPYAYIMDQWASRTVNLLVGCNVVLLDVIDVSRWEANGTSVKCTTTYSVSDNNTGDHYENFCLQMDGLSLKCGTGPEQVDRAAMGEGDTSWRSYLEAHRVGAGS